MGTYTGSQIFGLFLFLVVLILFVLPILVKFLWEVIKKNKKLYHLLTLIGDFFQGIYNYLFLVEKHEVDAEIINALKMEPTPISKQEDGIYYYVFFKKEDGEFFLQVPIKIFQEVEERKLKKDGNKHHIFYEKLAWSPEVLSCEIV